MKFNPRRSENLVGNAVPSLTPAMWNQYRLFISLWTVVVVAMSLVPFPLMARYGALIRVDMIIYGIATATPPFLFRRYILWRHVIMVGLILVVAVPTFYGFAPLLPKVFAGIALLWTISGLPSRTG